MPPDVKEAGGWLLRTGQGPGTRAERGQADQNSDRASVTVQPDEERGGREGRWQHRDRGLSSGRSGGGQVERTRGGGGTGSSASQKSSLDLLGIFDTRRFFYIPSERTGAEEEGDGILETLARWLKRGR